MTSVNNNIKVGSYLIDSNQVYEIYKIAEDRLYYRPAIAGGNHATVTGSIPAANIDAAGFRPLLDAKQIRQFYIDLVKSKPLDIPIDSKLYKDLIISNDPFKIIPLLKQLWKSKNTPLVNFSGSSRDTLEDIISHLSLEFSLSTDKSPDSIRKKILATLTSK
ncbi:MAG: hypothetical protein WAV41_02925 [Microgenomates group bacterium]